MSNHTPKSTRLSKNVASPYVNAKNLLSASVIDNLVGREEEYSSLYSKIKNSLELQMSLTFYVSGPAGTGKSLTVTNIVNDLKNVFSFKFISINCMSFQNASSFYDKILSNFEVKSKRLCRTPKERESLGDMYKIKDAISESDQMTILLLDEIDQLKSKNHEVLNNIFKLPSILKNKIILIGIANALDFTSKMIWLKDLSRDNFHECRFLPYDKDQIVKIIEHRLKISQNENILIDKFAIEYCARKIASCSGDIRKALDVCRRAIELLEINIRNNSGNIRTTPLKSNDYQRNIQMDKIDSVKHVDIRLMMSALNKVYGTAIDKIENESKVFLPSDQQVVLCTLLILMKAKSLHQVKLSECRQVLAKICTKRGISTDGKSESDILNMCQLLADYGYVSIENENVIALSKSSFAKARTPKKNKAIYLSLQIDSNEAEQLLSSFHKTIISNSEIYLN